MEDWEKKHYDKVKDLVKKGWLKEGAKVEHEDGNAYVREEYILLPIGVINDCGCMPTCVLWL
jgi:hypothetical protein